MSQRGMPNRGPVPRGPVPRRPVPRRAAPPRLASCRPGPSGHRYVWIKGGLLAALAVYIALVVGANAARDVDFAIICRAMDAVPGTADLKHLDENAVQERLDAAPPGDDWLMIGSEEIMDVSEVLIARADEGALDALEDAVRGRIENQLAVFRSYGTNQKALLDAAIVLRRGHYLFYAVGENAEAWEKAFLASVR